MEAVKLIVGVENLAALKEEWSDLLVKSAANTIFSTWDWHDLWWNIFGDDTESLIIAVRDKGELVGIAPFVKQSNVISFMGGSDVSDYLDIIAVRGREPEVLSTVFETLRQFEWDEIDLHCLKHDSSTLKQLPAIAMALRLVCAQEEEDVCPVVDLPGDWESYVASLSKKDRHELRRKVRRLLSQEDISWYVAPPDCNLDTIAETFIRLCRLSRAEKAEFLADDRMETFFRAILERFQPRGLLKAHIMEVAGQRVSATLCFDQGQEAWLYNSGFDPSYSHLSVGLLLKAFCLQEAIETGKTRFDFLRGREPYKYDLGGVDKLLYRLRIRKSPD